MKTLILTLFTVSLLIATAQAADPTTKPAGPKKPETAVTVVENAAFHFKVSIPKTWKPKQNSPKTTVYEVAGLPGALNGGILVLLGGKPNQKDAKLADIVDGKKDVLGKRSSNVKYITDEATTLGGAPAWRLVYDLPVTAKQSSTVNGKPAETKDVEMAQRSSEVMCLKDGTVVDIVYVGVAENFAAYAKVVDQVIASFEWTGIAAADKKQ